MKNDFEKRIVLAKTDKRLAEELIIEYTPFLKAVIRKYIVYINSYDFDDLFSVAMQAFNEAIKVYDSGKGYFISFAQLVVKRRLYNYCQKNQKTKKEIPISSLKHNGEDENDQYQIADNNAVYFDNPIRLEIEAIKAECLQFNIDFIKLEKYSPKAAKTKEVCQKAANEVLADKNLILYLKKNNMLPIKDICQRLKVSRKIIERHRQYIIAVIIIASGDYPCLSGYLNLKEDVKLI